MATYALAKDGFYINVIIADDLFVSALVQAREIDFATLIDPESDASQPSVGDPVPIYFMPANQENWPEEPMDLRDAANILASKPSCAVDKGDVDDQAVSGVDWVKVTASRVLWDSGFYDLEESWFTAPITGIYNHDLQLRLDALDNVASVEIALFRHVDGVVDDYWFTLAKEYITGSATQIHIGGSTQFDFYAGETFFMAIQLTPLDSGAPCSATILSSDDFTAWGTSWTTPLINSYRVG